MHALYNLGIRSYGALVWFAQFFNPKAKQWILGRKNWRKTLSSHPEIKGCYWFHCASLGEFEQGRPLMEELRKAQPTVNILVTFFSPSGYEIRKNYAGADLIVYLPLDTPKNARDFIQLVRPQQAFFVKYEFWANYLFELKKCGIPVYNISGVFRPEQRFFKRNNTFSPSILTCFTHFFVQNESSAKLLHGIGLSNVTVSGDTRYDRVLSNAQRVTPHPILANFVANQPTLVMGSSWPVDEQLIFPLITNGTITERIIIAPHEIDEAHIVSIEQQLPHLTKRLSTCTAETDFSHIQVLIIDCIGLLANAYSHGTYAYVGGAFGKGLHNILEPAVFGLPVIFGPNHAKFPEAAAFINAGIGFSIANSTEFEAARNAVLHAAEIHERTKQFIQDQAGATAMILKHLK